MYLGNYCKRYPVAVKVIRNKGDAPLSDQQKHFIESEVLMLDYLRHPSIVSCHGYVPDLKQILLVLELAPYGSLWSMARNQVSYPSLPLSLIVAWLTDVCDALKFIHSKKVVHKDIKCENILVFGGLALKLCDFGLAKLNDQSSIAGAGTGHFRAPEILAQLPSSPASDVYSFAITSLQLLSRSMPLAGDPSEQIHDLCSSITGADPQVGMSLNSVLCVCTLRDPLQRMSVVNLMQKLNVILQQLGGDPRLRTASGPAAEQVALIENEAKRAEMVYWRSSGMRSGGSGRSDVKSPTSVSSSSVPSVGKRNRFEVCIALIVLVRWRGDASASGAELVSSKSAIHLYNPTTIWSESILSYPTN